MSKKILINGPVNVIRLEGKVNNIQKILYVFFDFHMEPCEQTECSGIYGKDVKDYFVENFNKINKNNKKYDFFLEEYPTLLYKKQPDLRKKIYILEIRKLFEYMFRKKNEFPSVRSHYIDIRDYTEIYSDPLEQLSNIYSSIYRSNSISYQQFNNMHDLITQITNGTKILYDIFYDNKQIKISKKKPIIKHEHDIKYTTKDMYNNLIRLSNKIKDRYVNNNIRNFINKYMKDILNTSFINYVNTLDKLDKYINKNKKLLTQDNDLLDKKTSNYGLSPHIINKLILIIGNLMANIKDSYILMHLHFTDIYFLRRFLDKDYVTNAIVYCGARHGTNYIYNLVKYFDFKITHYSYLKYGINKTTNIIKKNKDYDGTEILFYPKKLVQCSDMTNFPKLFE